MLDIFTVSFFGHRFIYDYQLAENYVKKVVRELIQTKQFVDFLVGRDGDFDMIVSSTINNAKKTVFDANSSHIWVQPYSKAEYLKNPEPYDKYYDEIILCEKSAFAHPKSAIQIRNRYMVDRSDLIVFFVEQPRGSAYQTMQYAIKQNKNIINIADLLY